MALGAQASNIRNMVIREGMALALIGVVLGIGGALWLTRFLGSFLFGVQAWDPTAFSCDTTASLWGRADRYLDSGPGERRASIR